MNVRELALDILLEMEKSGTYANALIRGTLEKYDYEDPREKALLKQLVECTLEHGFAIDWALNSISAVPVAKMKPLIRALMRLSACQILYLEKIPDRAVCDEAVKLAKKRGFSGLSGFVNGVLRSLARQKDRVAWPDPKTDPVRALSVRYSLPEWLILLWREQYGEAVMEERLPGFVRQRPVTIRFRRDRSERTACGLPAKGGVCAKGGGIPQHEIAEAACAVPEAESGAAADSHAVPGTESGAAADSHVVPEAEREAAADFRAVPEAEARTVAAIRKTGVSAVPHPLFAGAWTLENVPGVGNLPGFGEGQFYAQDVSSMLAVAAAGIRPGMRVLDLCGAPGGKAILAAEYAGEEGLVLTGDISETKADLIRENTSRMGCGNIRIQVWDARIFQPELEKRADVVLADLPCSGLGVLGRKKDIRYRISRTDLEALTALQKEILSASWRYVRPGGVLLYSTCTVDRLENEDMAAYIRELGKRSLEDAAVFEMESLDAYLPRTLWSEQTRNGMLQLWPGQYGTDGFFLAKLRRLR